MDKELYIVFIDLEKAYTIEYPVNLFGGVFRRNVSLADRCVTIIRDMYNDCDID